MGSLKDKVVIAGIGHSATDGGSKFDSKQESKLKGVSDVQLALQACKMAIEDAGLASQDVDGIGCAHALDSAAPSHQIALGLGVPEISFQVDNYAGGAGSIAVVQMAAAAIEAGLARNIVCYRAMKTSTAGRLTGHPRGASISQFPDYQSVTGEAEFMAPFGLDSVRMENAMRWKRHMIKYGTTSEHTGAVAITHREHAAFNDRALARQPITMEDYLNSPMVVDPVRELDICLASDGGYAVVLTSAESARDLKQSPVYIMGAAMGGGPLPGYASGFPAQAPEPAEAAAKYFSKRLYNMADVGPNDMDFAQIYDCFTFAVIYQLEGYGFCKEGEGGPFVEDGRIALGGELPVNTHGGQLSEGYFWSMNHLYEAVQQLRGHAGARQVKDAEIGLVTGHTAQVGSALILRR